MSGRRLRWAVGWVAAAVVVPAAATGQEPIFTTPPVTMYQRGLVAGAAVEARRGGYAASAETAVGVWSRLTLGLGALGTEDASGPLQLARVHVGGRLRLLKVDRPAQWVLLSVYGLSALPAGETVDRVAKSGAVPDVVVGVSAARMARRGDLFADVSIARTPTPSGARLSGNAGLAAGWRPAPQAYGRAEVQLFAEARARYAEGGSAVLGLAPGVLVHTHSALVKLGVLFPAWERDVSEKPTILVAVKLLR